MANIDLRNGSGYVDPTAQKGLNQIVRAENKVVHDKTALIKNFQAAAHSAGFEVEGRIVLRHKRSGRLFEQEVGNG